MIVLLPFFILFFSGIASLFPITKKPLYFILFIVSPIISSLLFVAQIFSPYKDMEIPWIIINNIVFYISVSFGIVESIICSIVCFLLFVVNFSALNLNIISYRNNKTYALLNIFCCFMCFSVVSTNLFQFFIGLEMMSIISSLLVGFEKQSFKNSSIVFLYNKFASILFLIGSFIIYKETNSCSLYTIKTVFEYISYDNNLFIASLFLLIACLCKSTQFPFTKWLIDATKSNISVSILLHSSTLVCIGVVFISKYYFIFERFEILQSIMLYIGSITAVLSSVCSIFQNNIKKLIAYSTSASIGIMFISLGLGEYSIAILYMICHALFKSIFFLAFSYVVVSTFNEYNILKLGGLSNYIPNIVDILWISFISTIGIPFFISSFGKMALLDYTFSIQNIPVVYIIIISNIILIVSYFRAITISMYGRTRIDDSTLYRIKDASTKSITPMWILIISSIFISFIVWILYDWNILHFGYIGNPYETDSINYLKESLLEIIQIISSFFIIILIKHYRNLKNTQSINKLLRNIFNNDNITRLFYSIFKKIALYILYIFETSNNYLERMFMNIILIKNLKLSGYIDTFHRQEICSHLNWMIFGFIISVLICILWSILKYV